MLEIYWEVHIRHPHLADSAVRAVIADLQRVSHTHSSKVDSTHSNGRLNREGGADEMMCFIKNMLTVLKHVDSGSARQQSIQ